MRGDEVDDLLLDVRPDGGAGDLAARGAAEVLDLLAEVGEVGHRHDDVEVPVLRRRGRDDLDGPSARQVAGDLLDRAHRGRQADALRGLRQQRVEPLQRQGEVGPALGAGEGVDLVDDDRLDPDERLACGRGEHEEERLGRRDEDVGGGPGEGAPLVGRGVARAHRHADLRRLEPEPGRGVPDADERGAQVALDVDGEGLERRDVEDPAAGEPLGRGLGGDEPVEGPQEGGQRLARAGRGDDERVRAAADGAPRALLRGRRPGEARREPGARRGREEVEDVLGGGGVGCHGRDSLPPGTDSAAARGRCDLRTSRVARLRWRRSRSGPRGRR